MKSSSSKPKKKLEITVLDARPMSQSGFIDEHSVKKQGGGAAWSLEYAKLHPSHSADNIADEKDCLVEFGVDSGRNNNGSVMSSKRPTIIRPSKSNDNLKGSAYRVDTGAAYSTSDLFKVENEYDSLPIRQVSSTMPRQQPGAIINPGFRLESDKRVPAPPRPRKKQPPPRPPPMKTAMTNRDPMARSRCTSGADDLINFDPLAPSCGPDDGRENRPPANRGSIMSELEGLFSQTATNSAPPPPKPLRANSRCSSRPTSLVRPILTVPHCVALHDFEPETNEDMAMKIGDTIRLISMREDKWFFGCNLRTQKEGLLPSTFVDVKIPLATTENVSQPPSYPKPKPRSSSMTSIENCDSSPADSASSNPPPSVKSLWPPPSDPPPPPPIARKPSSTGRTTQIPPVAPKPHRTTPVATVNPEPATGGLATRRPVWPPAKQISPPISPPPPLSSKPKPRAPQCRATFGYNSGEEGDLRFDPGDIIHLLDRVNDEWLKGELRGKVGIFPKTFVEIEQDLPSPKVNAAPEPVKIPEPKVWLEVKALYDYDGPDGDLSFSTGDTIKVTKVVSTDWMEGSIRDKHGLFPSNFVKKLGSSAPVPPPPPPPKLLPKAQAVYSFQAQTKEDLTFHENDIIMLKEEVDAEWLRGEINGCVGIFPKSFVKVLVPL